MSAHLEQKERYLVNSSLAVAQGLAVIQAYPKI